MKPLVYYSVYGDSKYVEMLDLSLQSLYEFGNYRGDILILTDQALIKNLSQLEILNSFQSYDFHVLKNEFNIASGLLNRYSVHSYANLEQYDCVLYLDVDVLLANDISFLFKICNIKKLYVACEDEFLINSIPWFGEGIFANEEVADINTRLIRSINSGIFMFNDPQIIKDLANFMKEEAVRFAPIPPSFEQGIFNVYFYRTKKYLPFLTYYEIRTRDIYAGPVEDKLFVHVFDELGNGDSKVARLHETFRMIASQKRPNHHR